MQREAKKDGLVFGRKLLEDFAASLDMSPRSVVSYKKCLAYFFDYLAEKGIDRPEAGHIAAYRETLAASGRKPATVYSYLNAVRAFFRWAQSRGLYPDIAAGMKIPQVDHRPNRKTLTGPQLKRVMDSIDRDSLQGLRDYAILAVMVTGGLSALEVSRASVADLHASTEGDLLYIRDWDGERRDVVKLPFHVVRALSDYLEARGTAGPDAPLFISASVRNRSKNEHMSAGSVSRIVKGALRNAGYDDARLTAQSLRASAVKLALQGGERLEDVQRFARHKNIRTTFFYREQAGLTPEGAACGEGIAQTVFPPSRREKHNTRDKEVLRCQ